MVAGEGGRTHVEDAGLWIARVRLIVVPFAVADLALMSRDYPSGYQEAAWITTGVFAAGAIALFFASRRYSSAAGPAGLVFDASIVGAYSTIYSFEYGSPTCWAFIFVILEAALVYGLVGVIVITTALLPFLVFVEWWRVDHFAGPGSCGPASCCRSPCLRCRVSSSAG
jgi:hypothetical protein